MLKVKLHNFRGFSEEPAILDLSEKFVSLVGPNNSGKSTLLRALFELRIFFKEFARSERFIDDRPLAIGADLLDMFSRNNTRPMQVEVEYDPDSLESYSRINTPVSVNRVSLTINRDGTHAVSAFKDSEALDLNAATDLKPLRVISRGFAILGDAFYAGPFRNVLSVTPATKYYDLDIGSHFIASFDQWRSGPDSYRRFEVRKLIEEIESIFALGRLEITTSSDKQTLTIDLDNGSFTLSELGAGLSQFLILVLHAATYKPPLLLIDEPEMNLHPRLQVELLQVLSRYCDTLVFATHNIGLTRTLSNTRYITERTGTKNVLKRQEHYPRLPELLGEMNYSGQHELYDGVAAVLFVEGPTDVPVFRTFLKLIHRADKVLVLSLNGASSIRASRVAELHELKRVSPKVAVIIDSEKAGASEGLSLERVSFISACHAAGIQSHVLSLRAIENYFTSRAIAEAFDTSFVALKPYEKLADANKRWSKSKNTIIADKMNKDEIARLDFFSFLQQLDITKDSTIIALPSIDEI